jgi:hypothetical protein
MICEPTTNSFLTINLRQLDELKEQFNELGFVAIAYPAVRPDIFDELVIEAAQQKNRAWLCYKPRNKGLETAQHNYRAEPGSIASAILTDASCLQTLSYITGRCVTPSFNASCYTYYDADDFLAIHTDRVKDCTITLLLYVKVRYGSFTGENSGISLNLYNKTGDDTYKEFLKITPSDNMIFIVKGSEIFHGRNRLQWDESISLLSLCYGIKDEWNE